MIDVDYCVELFIIVNVYVVIVNSKLLVIDIKLKLSGNYKESECKNV